jgi:peroxiredoxin
VRNGAGAVGDRLPDVSLPRLDGGELRLADLRGKRLLLFMWGSW